MEQLRFEGAWTALVTPFTKEGNIDWEGLEKNIEFQVSQGIRGLVPTGTTGESPTLGWKEHNQVVEKAVKVAGKRCPVMAGTGSNSTKETLAGAEEAMKIGVQAVLLVDCYYNGPSSWELREEYYRVVAKAFPELMVVPYVIPGRTGTEIFPEDLALLAQEFPNVRAVKEATGDLERMIRTRQLVGNDFDILSGDDNLTFEIMARPGIRAAGAVSVISNVVPGAIEEMTRKIIAGDSVRAGNLNESLKPFFDIVTVKVKDKRVFPDEKKINVKDRFRNPLPLKTLMNGLGMPAGPCRQPLGLMSREGVERVHQAACTVWKNSPEILKPIEKIYGVSIEERLEKSEYWNKLAYG